MTRLRVALLISVVVAAPVHGQVSASSDTVKALAKSAGLHVKYDRIEGRTTLRGDKWEVKGNAVSLGPSIDLRIACVSDGEMIEAAKTTCGLGFTANGGAFLWGEKSARQAPICHDV